MEIIKKKENMDNKNNPLSGVRRYAEWLKDNIFEISSMCGWGGIIREKLKFISGVIVVLQD